MNLVVCEDSEHVATRATELFFELRPNRIALAGGDTPRDTYSKIAKRPIDWGPIQAFLTDERCVPWDHPASNYRMLRETIFTNHAFVAHPISTDGSPQDSAASYREEVAGVGPFDFIFLGLGEDGHTASLFPGAFDSSGTDDLVMPSWSKETGLWRVTLTLKAINAALNVAFLVVGKSKSAALERVLRSDPVPAAKVAPVESVTFIVDRAAAPA